MDLTVRVHTGREDSVDVYPVRTEGEEAFGGFDCTVRKGYLISGEGGC